MALANITAVKFYSTDSRANPIKLFIAEIYEYSKKARVFVPGRRTFQVFHSRDRLLASPTNIRLGWKGLPRTNTLGCYENS